MRGTKSIIYPPYFYTKYFSAPDPPTKVFLPADGTNPSPSSQDLALILHIDHQVVVEPRHVSTPGVLTTDLHLTFLALECVAPKIVIRVGSQTMLRIPYPP